MYMDLRQKYWWDGMYSDCRKLCEQCEDCQHHKKGPTENRNKMIPLPVPSKPWQVVCTDIVGPIVLPNNEKAFFFLA